MAGLAACTGLQELYLSHNGISQLEVSASTHRHVAPSKWCVEKFWSRLSQECMAMISMLPHDDSMLALLAVNAAEWLIAPCIIS